MMSLVKIVIFTMVLPYTGCMVVQSDWAIEADKGNDPAAKAIIAKGVDASSVDQQWNTPFLWAAKHGYAETVRSMINRGTPINQKNQTTGETALMLATKNGHIDVVNLLIEEGADVSLKDNSGKTALDWAAIKGNQKIVSELSPRNGTKSSKDEKTNPLVCI